MNIVPCVSNIVTFDEMCADTAICKGLLIMKDRVLNLIQQSADLWWSLNLLLLSSVCEELDSTISHFELQQQQQQQ